METIGSGHRLGDSPAHRLRPCAWCLAIMLGPWDAWAGGFQITEQNSSGLGSAFAGQAALADDASVIHYNPANMLRLAGRRQVLLTAQAVQPYAQFHDAGSCAPYAGAGAGSTACPFGAGGNLGHAPGSVGIDNQRAATVPQVYVAQALLPNLLWGGIGVTVPFGSSTRNEASWLGRFRAIESKISTININPSLALRIPGLPSTVVGLGLDVQQINAKLTNAVSYYAAALGSGSAPLVAAVPAGSEGIATIKASSWGYGWNAGVDVGLGDDWHLAATYRSPVRHTLKGNAGFDGRPAAFAGVPQVADGRVSADVRLPGVLSLAASWQVVPRVKVLADWTRTGWHSIQDVDVVRADGPLAGQVLSTLALRFQDSHRVGLGASWAVDDQLTLRTGVAHETSAVKDLFRTPTLPDAPKNWYGAGARWRFSQRWAVDVGFAYLRIKSAPVALANQETPTAVPRGSMVGQYATHARILGAQLAWTMD